MIDTTQYAIRVIVGFVKDTGKRPKTVRMHPKTLYVFREHYSAPEIAGIPIEPDASCKLGAVCLSLHK